MAVATEQEQFESVGFVKGITDGKFDGSFVAELSNGDKLYGSKTKQDGSPAKVWPLIKESFDKEKYFKWTGNLKQGDKGSFKKVTFGFEVEEGPGPQPNYVPPEDKPAPPPVATSTAPGRITINDLPVEIAKPLEGAHKASQAMQNGRKDDRNASFALSYAKDFVVGLFAADPQHDDFFQQVNITKGIVLSVADDFKEWLDQQ